jgi:hypothetical protein
MSRRTFKSIGYRLNVKWEDRSRQIGASWLMPIEALRGM